MLKILAPLTSLAKALRTLIRHRYLFLQMTRREVSARYRGTAMGWVWSLITPLLMLGVYTFMFGYVFKARWPNTAADDHGLYTIILFAGLIPHGFLAECMNRAPGLIVSQPNLVKKVVLPLDLLGWVTVGSAGFQTLLNFLVLLAAELAIRGSLPVTVLLAPLAILPLAILLAGLVWFLAATGVFLRDIGQTMGLVTTVLLFTAPIFYPADAIPEPYREWLVVNPLTIPVEALRHMVVEGVLPDFRRLGLYLAVALLVATLGHFWFERSRRAFADVM